MRTGIVRPLLIAATLVLASCGATGDAESAATTSNPPANETSTTSPATESTATSPDTTETPTTDAPTATSPVEPCPEVPLPDDITTTAAAAFDGDGDGDDDTLATFEQEGSWWIGVEWAAGGSGWIMLNEAESMGAKAIGGHDLDGDGVDEAFIGLLGPASGLNVQVLQQDQCGLKPILLQNDEPFTFPVTGTAGMFTAAECGSPTDIALITGSIVAPETGTVEVERVSYSFDSDSGTMVGEDSTLDTVEGVDIAEVSGLRCGDLDEAMSQLD